VCRKCYIHSAVLEAYLAGDLMKRLPSGLSERRHFSAEEAAVLAFLRGYAARRLPARKSG
jgi:DNA topoisomerase-1